MSKNARDFRRLLRLSIASLSIASVVGWAPKADAQQSSLGYSDAIVLPKYYPGMGRIMVLGGIESAKPSAGMTVSHRSSPIPLVQSSSVQNMQPNSAEKTFTIQATVEPNPSNQVKVVVLQQPVVAAPNVVATPVPNPVETPAPAQVSPPQVTRPQAPQIQANPDNQKPKVEPNQESQLRRRIEERDTNVRQPREIREVQPERDQPQLRRDQPRVVQGALLNPAIQDRANGDRPNGDRPSVDRNRNDNPNRDVRGPRDQENERASRPDANRGVSPDSRRQGPDGPANRGPGFKPGFTPGQGPWMRGGMDFGPQGAFPGVPNGPGAPNIPGNQPGRMSNNGPGQDLDSMDRIFNSPAVRQFLQLKEENLQLKAELKMKERELEMKMEMTEMRLRMHMQEAEKRVDQANKQMAEMKEQVRREKNAEAPQISKNEIMEQFEKFREQRMQDAPRREANAELARPDLDKVRRHLFDLEGRERRLESTLGKDHPTVVELRKEIAAVREKIGVREPIEPGREKERDSNKRNEASRIEQKESQDSIQRVTAERNRLVAELEGVLKQSAEMKRKLEAVAQEKMNAEKAVIEAKQSAEKQIEKVKQAAAEAIEKAKSVAQKTEVKKPEAKKEEAKKEKGENRKKQKESDEDSDDDDDDEMEDEDEDMEDEDGDDEDDEDDEDE